MSDYKTRQKDRVEVSQRDSPPVSEEWVHNFIKKRDAARRKSMSHPPAQSSGLIVSRQEKADHDYHELCVSVSRVNTPSTHSFNLVTSDKRLQGQILSGNLKAVKDECLQSTFKTEFIFFNALDESHSFLPTFIQVRYSIASIKYRMKLHLPVNDIERGFLDAVKEATETPYLFDRRLHYISAWKASDFDHYAITEEDKEQLRTQLKVIDVRIREEEAELALERVRPFGLAQKMILQREKQTLNTLLKRRTVKKRGTLSILTGATSNILEQAMVNAASNISARTLSRLSTPSDVLREYEILEEDRKACGNAKRRRLSMSERVALHDLIYDEKVEQARKSERQSMVDHALASEGRSKSLRGRSGAPKPTGACMTVSELLSGIGNMKLEDVKDVLSVRDVAESLGALNIGIET